MGEAWDVCAFLHKLKSSSQLACGSLSQGKSSTSGKLIHVLLLTTFCLFLELRKYQKLVEPPPSAKPITMDVDRKLEDGQKVTPVLCYRKEHLKGKVVASLNSVWGCCFHVFKQMKWVC